MDENQVAQVVLPVDNIESIVYIIRGRQVMLDTDLALLYGYDVKRLNEQARRNIERFPEDFMFLLTDDEVDQVWSQNATANINSKTRTNPVVYSEQGVYMLAAVLKKEVAVAQSVKIMRAFREMRHYLRQNQQFVTKNELKILTDAIEAETEEIIARQDETDIQIANIHQSINKINENFILDTEIKNYVIYKGQKFEADAAYIDIYQKAKESIYVIDDYVNIKTLHLLSHKKSDVEVILFTENKRGRNGALTASEVTDFDAEYPTIRLKPNPDCHDRFIVLDYGKGSEKVFHCGASSKDAGNKVCAINAIENSLLIHPIIDALMQNPDKTI